MRGSASADILRPLSVRRMPARSVLVHAAHCLRLRDDDRSEVAQDVAPHARRGVQVLVAFELPREPLDRVLDAGAPSASMRRTSGVPAMPPTPSADAGRALDHGGDRDDGEIAVPARHLAERRRRRT